MIYNQDLIGVHPLLVFVMGCTNTGKSTLMRLFKEWAATSTVEVGVQMRLKYDPSHFKGQNNPKHTAAEAWRMMLDGIAAGHGLLGEERDLEYPKGLYRIGGPRRKIIVIDGQPRDTNQTNAICDIFVNGPKGSDGGEPHEQIQRRHPCMFLTLDAPHETLVQRAHNRGDDQASVKLSLDRLVSDYRNNYNVLLRLAGRDIHPDVWCTGSAEVDEYFEGFCDFLEDKGVF